MAKKKSPRVSVFMPVFNGGRYIAATIDSLLQQTYSDFELIIADDGSTDNTVAIVRRISRRDARVQLLQLPHQGEVAARNTAIAAANPGSEYLLNHDSDDISLPDKFQQLVAYLDRHGNIAIVGCAGEYLDENGRINGAPAIEYTPQQIRARFAVSNPMINSCALIRRIVFARIGLYREEFRSADDYDFFCRALLAGFELANIPQVLHHIRRHRASISSTREQLQIKLAARIAAFYEAETVKRTQITAPKASGNLARTRLVVLHTSEFYHPHVGGSETVVQELSEKLADRGHLVTVATSMQHERQEGAYHGVAIRSFDLSGSAAQGVLGTGAAQYRDFLLRQRADVIMNYGVQHWASDLAFPLLDTLAERSALVIAPCGYSALGANGRVEKEIFKTYYRHAISLAIPKYQAAVYHSARYRDYLFAQRCRFGNSVVIPNGARAEEFTTAPEFDFRRHYGITTPLFGLCVANYYPGKGQEHLIDMLRALPRADFTLVLIGREGNCRDDLLRRAHGLPVKILSDLPRRDTLAAFFAADLFLLASDQETSPLVIVEAEAAGVPFVATPVGNVRDYPGGVVCSLAEMPKAMQRLLDDGGERRRLGAQGRSDWLAKRTWSAIAERYEDLYLRLAEQRHAGKPALKNWQKRLAQIQRQIDQRPLLLDHYRQAADLLRAHGQNELAAQYISDGLELAPDDSALQKMLSTVCGEP